MVITDLHLDINNIEIVRKIVHQSIDIAKQLQLTTLFVGGDVFTSRKSQFLAVLLAWNDILDYAQQQGIYIVAIPGNHDKADYTSKESYLDIYQEHENFELVRDYRSFELGKYTLHLVPFFDEASTYTNYLKLAKPKGDYDILLTHIAVNGVRNNDGSQVEQGIGKSSFSKYFKVLVGHYHDIQQVGKNIHYIGSIRQKDYGEDDQKGFTVVYDDGSHELMVSEFDKFVTIKVDLDTTDIKQLNVLKKHYADSQDHIRFKFTGSKEKVTALDKSTFDALGIDVKCEYKDVEINLSYEQAKAFTGFDSSKIKSEWSEFCQQNDDIDQQQGLQLLNEIL